MKDYIIIMADIVDSRKSNQKQLMSAFKKVIDEVNIDEKDLLISPLTITLGDEFQGIANNVCSAVKLLFTLQEKIIKKKTRFSLRYVIFEGRIDTPINHEIAHGMLGEGLTSAREILETNKNNSDNYYFNLKNKEQTEALLSALLIYQSIVEGWNLSRDEELIIEFLELDDYKKVAEKLGKTRSQIWKRRKSLQIEEYLSVKKVINYIAK